MQAVITYDQFKAQVNALWADADDGIFKNHSPSFVDCQYYPGRIWYTWQHYTGFGAVCFDTLDPKPWFIDQGRGAHGHGHTLTEAIQNERYNYYPD